MSCPTLQINVRAGPLPEAKSGRSRTDATSVEYLNGYAFSWLQTCTSSGLRPWGIMTKYFARAEAPSVSREESIVVLDAIRADWSGFESGPFALAANMGEEDSPASRYWQAVFQVGPSVPDAFEGAPVVRIEMDSSIDGSIPRLVRDERLPWLEFDVGDTPGAAASMFEPGTKGLFDSEEVDAQVGNFSESEYSVALDRIFDMASWPDADQDELSHALWAVPAVSQIVAFDVGQGGANALIDTKGVPRLYFDAGAGMGRHAKSTPANLSFCVCRHPPIILSHWDTDHWAGARADPRLLSHVWIAPRQPIGITHAIFANDILRNRGTVLIYSSKSVFTYGLRWDQFRWGNPGPRPNQILSIVPCTGTSRNDSGLALVVHDQDRDLDWLLTGDASYSAIPHTFAADRLVVVTASHHGAQQPRRSFIPARTSNTAAYSRLLYSFAQPNAFGHPHPKTISDNSARGWRHGAMVAPYLAAGMDALATGLGDTTRPRASLSAGWRRRPLLPRHLLDCLVGLEILR